MVKKDKRWKWTEKQEEAFKELKKRFTEKPVLAAPDIDKKNENRGGCIGLCDGRCTIDGMWRWTVEAGSLPF